MQPPEFLFLSPHPDSLFPRDSVNTCYILLDKLYVSNMLICPSVVQIVTTKNTQFRIFCLDVCAFNVLFSRAGVKLACDECIASM